MEEEASMKNLIKGRELQEIIDDFEHDFRLIAWDKSQLPTVKTVGLRAQDTQRKS